MNPQAEYRLRILSPLRKPVPPPGRINTKFFYLLLAELKRIVEAPAGVAPANGGFADRCVSYFTTAPFFNSSFKIIAIVSVKNQLIAGFNRSFTIN